MGPLTWIAYTVGAFLALTGIVGAVIIVAALVTAGGAIIAMAVIALIILVVLRECWVSVFGTKNKAPQ